MAKEKCYDCQIEAARYPKKNLKVRWAAANCMVCGHGFCKPHLKKHPQDMCRILEGGLCDRAVRRQASPTQIGELMRRMAKKRKKK